MSQRFCFISPFRSCHIDLKVASKAFTWVRARAGGRGWLGWKCDTLASYQSHFLSTYNCDCCHFMSLALKTKQICLPVRFL